MANLQLKLEQISSQDAPGIGFYSTVASMDGILLFDTATSTLLPPSNVTSSNISLVEHEIGVWSHTLDITNFPDGFYIIRTYEATQNLQAADDHYLYVVNGDVRTSEAIAEIHLDHDYTFYDFLRYVSLDGVPVEGATVRVYSHTDWNTEPKGSTTGITSTGPDGRWLSSVPVRSGQTYVIQFHKAGEYGPDVVSVTI